MHVYLAKVEYIIMNRREHYKLYNTKIIPIQSIYLNLHYVGEIDILEIGAGSIYQDRGSIKRIAKKEGAVNRW